MAERWKKVPGLAPDYEVSNQGRVRSSVSGNPRILTAFRTSKGYLKCTVRAESGRRKQMRVHRMVLLAFRGAPALGQESRHLNGDPGDNRLKNLRWGTWEENRRDAEKHGRLTITAGEAHYNAKLSEDDVREIRAAKDAGARVADIADIYGVAEITIYNLLGRKTWRGVQ